MEGKHPWIAGSTSGMQHILFVPGFWEGSAPFSDVASLLQAQVYSTEIAILPSTGTTSPGNPNMKDDIEAICSTVTNIVDKGQHVVLVLHSAGGFLGSNAIEGLSLKARQGKQLSGGVSKIVFLARAIFPEGFKHGPLPFFTYDDKGAMHCQTPEKILFNDLEDRRAKAWVKDLQSQPASDWDDTITYCGWKDFLSVYLVCEGDKCIPPDIQLQLAETAGSQVEKCAAGHIPMISMADKVVDVIVNAAQA